MRPSEGEGGAWNMIAGTLMSPPPPVRPLELSSASHAPDADDAARSSASVASTTTSTAAAAAASATQVVLTPYPIGIILHVIYIYCIYFI